ncbi:MAG: aminotransferase class IV, partial [Bacteroidales bacterium]
EHLSSFSAVIARDYDRAAPQGSGSYKIGANYACSFKPYKMAHDQGYTEILYLNSKTKEFIDEFGSSNFFAIKGNSYVTPLSDSVLPSITNKSLQQVAADFGMKVEKRPIRVEELYDFDEAAACGTAVVITPMAHIDDKPAIAGKEISHVYRFFPDGVVGPVCQKLYKRLTGIQFGELPDPHGWCHIVE